MKLTGIFLLVAMGVLSGCAGNGAPQFNQARTLDLASYENLYYSHTYSCIYYAGSDDSYNYYVMQHWTYYNKDKSDGKMDSQDIFKIEVDAINVPQPMALTSDQEKWVLVWPQRLEQVQ